MTYCIIDLANTYHRGMFIKSNQPEYQVGLALNATFNIIQKAYNDFDADKIIIGLEGNSWRYNYYPLYKNNRKLLKVKNQTPESIEQDKLLTLAYYDLVDFFTNSTNITTLYHPALEGDDVIAGWVQNHKKDSNIIISGDSDFIQLLDNNTLQYNGVSDEIYTLSGIFHSNGKPVMNNKTKSPKQSPDPLWQLFKKCIRGEVGENIFSAYPGVREKGSTKRIGMIEAYNDMHTQGYNWTNFMMQEWTDHNGDIHKVKEDYERNKKLIDLTCQPEEIREYINATCSSIQNKYIPQIGVKFLKFCAKYELLTLADKVNNFIKIL